jgi:hypothetical protein
MIIYIYIYIYIHIYIYIYIYIYYREKGRPSRRRLGATRRKSAQNYDKKALQLAINARLNQHKIIHIFHVTDYNIVFFLTYRYVFFRIKLRIFSYIYIILGNKFMKQCSETLTVFILFYF